MTAFASLDAVPGIPPAVNEPVKSYAPGSPERAAIKAKLKALSGERRELPCIINGKEVSGGRMQPVTMPHHHGHVLAEAHPAGGSEIEAAVNAALAARAGWSSLPWQERAGVFLRAADLLSGPWRDTLNAATMLGQSKTVHQAEIDAAAELADFWRFNAAFLARIYAEQPLSPPGNWNRSDYRPLDGFVLALTPFNFTSIAGNLPTAPALCGNTVVWKPAGTAKYAAHFIMALLRQAGLPDGVINLVYGQGQAVAEIALSHPLLAGVHFTGSTEVFNAIVKRTGEGRYRSYPRLVGETGGKNFILAHPSAEVEALATAIIRGGFEYQGQKCSAASRLYVPANLWPGLRDRLAAGIESIAYGDVADFRNFMGAVIDEAAWNKLSAAQEEARSDPAYRLICGGAADAREGWFIGPTLVQTRDPVSRLMCEELFGPIVTVFVYDAAAYEDTIALIDRSSDYGLTGAVFATERAAVTAAQTGLRQAAGNFYINDKPTGAVVGQQPFGGARASGTNDKAGSMWNLMRWLSPRTVKENFVPPKEWRYPFMGEA
jgi:1-pyrroline-5-carboxylate dehydrogenase